MTESLHQLLRCPACEGILQQTQFEKGDDGAFASGVLACPSCDFVYPVIEGVPRFVAGGVKEFPAFVSRNKDKLKELFGLNGVLETRATIKDQDDYDNIRRSFSQEWSIFDYEADKTWGWTLEDRKKVFLGDVAFTPAQLTGKKMLDAGCGNGTMTAALSDFGLDIVGLDLNDGLGRAYVNRGRYSDHAVRRVQYVQGNLVTPPLRNEAFDLIYSSGVIHHTPSSKKTFKSLVRLTKSGGRLYVWVYKKRAWPVRLFFAFGRSLKRWMSLRAVMRVCQVLAPFYKLAVAIISKVSRIEFRSRTAREITLDLFDAFAPRYNHWHTETEVRSWFEEQGFENIHVSGIQKHGFGMYGDKKK